ncbi:MAG TPA: hypothetical protein VMV59_02385, partial [Candidatus Dormibacteraeota bacterium]|nr:hypothetical protein [Candidatus Dormibacteraeota bacterium]
MRIRGRTCDAWRGPYTPRAPRGARPSPAFTAPEFRMSAPSYDVVGIGNAIVDVLARTDDALVQHQTLAKGT